MIHQSVTKRYNDVARENGFKQSPTFISNSRSSPVRKRKDSKESLRGIKIETRTVLKNNLSESECKEFISLKIRRQEGVEPDPAFTISKLRVPESPIERKETAHIIRTSSFGIKLPKSTKRDLSSVSNGDKSRAALMRRRLLYSHPFVFLASKAGTQEEQQRNSSGSVSLEKKRLFGSRPSSFRLFKASDTLSTFDFGDIQQAKTTKKRPMTASFGFKPKPKGAFRSAFHVKSASEGWKLARTASEFPFKKTLV